MYIRSLIESDIEDVATIHVNAWRHAYKTIMPDDFLSALDVTERAERWRNGYNAHKNDPRRDTLLSFDGDYITGFLSYGPARDDDRTNWLEIYAINICPNYWGKANGYSLFAAACNRLRNLNAKKTYLWVLDNNYRALNAYKRWGGKVEDRNKTIEIGGTQLKETSILFNL